MYIGPLSRATGATPKAIRLYESLGLLKGVLRQGAYRIYSENHVRQVLLIRRAQALGFKLAELNPVLANGRGEPDWNQVVVYLKQKQATMRQEIDRLQRLDAQIDLVLVELTQCASAPPDAVPEICETLPA
jgi:DNA-binding transcriptional MerR regulator